MAETDKSAGRSKERTRSELNDITVETEVIASTVAEEKAKEKRDRLAQSNIEYWKIQYDYYKHLMTFDLAASAAFGTLLASVFNDPTQWGGWIPISRSSFILLTFGLFFWSIHLCSSAMNTASANIRGLAIVQTLQEYDQLVEDWQKRYSVSFLAYWSFFVGVICLLVFIGSHL